MREALKILAGSIGVYVVVAACSARGGDQPFVSGPVDPGAGGDGPTAMAGTSGAQGVAGEGSGGMMGASGTGSSGMSGSAGTTEPADAGLTDAIVDAMTDPVPDASADPNTSGTRLRARYLVGADGSRQFVGWRDTERNEDCGFSTASDGVQRCLPTIGTGASTFFLDAGCTSPVFVTVNTTTTCATSAAPKYGYQISSCSQFRLFQLTPTAAPAAIYIGTPETCVAGTVSSSYTFYTGTEIAASAFVAATEEVE